MRKLDEEQLESVIKAFREAASTLGFRSALKRRGLINPKFVVGKWYKSSEGELFCVTSLNFDDKPLGYGFYLDKEWLDNDNKYWNSYGCSEATNKEVEEALIKEAKERGFKEGVRFRSLASAADGVMDESFILFEGSFGGQNSLESSFMGTIINAVLFKDGVWATIIEEKKELVIDGITYVEK